MNTTTSHEVLTGKMKVFTRTWLPENIETRANIILVHGIGEHSGRYKHVAEYFTSSGFAIYAFDQIGHGKSDGKRGVESYPQVYDIITNLKYRIKAKQPDLPIILYGHSMGGAIVLSYGLNHPEGLKGVIATSPAVGMADPMPDKTIQFMKILKKIIPNFTIVNGLNLSGLSQDPEIAEEYSADSLVHNRVSLRLGLDLIQTGHDLLANVNVYPIPLLILQGDKDILVNPGTTDEFAKKIKGKITYKKIVGGYHELHNEPNKKEIFQTFTGWIDHLIKNKEEIRTYESKSIE
ncbi:MAG: lysophospholipase [Flexilinea sp.]